MLFKILGGTILIFSAAACSSPKSYISYAPNMVEHKIEKNACYELRRQLYVTKNIFKVQTGEGSLFRVEEDLWLKNSKGEYLYFNCNDEKVYVTSYDVLKRQNEKVNLENNERYRKIQRSVDESKLK